MIFFYVEPKNNFFLLKPIIVGNFERSMDEPLILKTVLGTSKFMCKCKICSKKVVHIKLTNCITSFWIFFPLVGNCS